MAGGLVTMILADLVAEVIRLEPHRDNPLRLLEGVGVLECAAWLGRHSPVRSGPGKIE